MTSHSGYRCSYCEPSCCCVGHSKVPSRTGFGSVPPYLCPVFWIIVTVGAASQPALLADLHSLARVCLMHPFTCSVSFTESVPHFGIGTSLCKYFSRARLIDCNNVNVPIASYYYYEVAKIMAGKHFCTLSDNCPNSKFKTVAPVITSEHIQYFPLSKMAVDSKHKCSFS